MFWIVFAAYAATQIAALRQLTGRWRLGAWAALAIMAGAIMVTVSGLSAGSNLAPIIIIFTSAALFVALTLLIAIHFLTTRPTR